MSEKVLRQWWGDHCALNTVQGTVHCARWNWVESIAVSLFGNMIGEIGKRKRQRISDGKIQITTSSDVAALWKVELGLGAGI